MYVVCLRVRYMDERRRVLDVVGLRVLCHRFKLLFKSVDFDALLYTRQKKKGLQLSCSRKWDDDCPTTTNNLELPQGKAMLRVTPQSGLVCRALAECLGFLLLAFCMFLLLPLGASRNRAHEPNAQVPAQAPCSILQRKGWHNRAGCTDTRMGGSLGF